MVLGKLTQEEKEMLEEAYREYGLDIIKLTMKKLQDPALAEDCVHNVVVKLMALYKSKENSAEPISKLYILRMATNEAIDMLRKRQYEVPAGTGIGEGTASISETENKSGIILRDKYGFTGKVSTALERLSELDNQIIFLTYKMGYNNVETAEILGLTEANVAKRLSRARKAMKKVLEREGKYE